MKNQYRFDTPNFFINFCQLLLSVSKSLDQYRFLLIDCPGMHSNNPRLTFQNSNQKIILCIAYVAGVQKGREETFGHEWSARGAQGRRKGKAFKDTINCLLRYNIHQVNVKILIGQASKQLSITTLMP